MRALRLVFLGAVVAASAWTQTSNVVTLVGRVYQPDGRPVSREVRLQFHDETFRRPPEYIYTDGYGRFEVTRVRTMITYVITVETDEKTWETTTISFMPSGNNPRVDVYLQPLRRAPPVPAAKSSVTVGELLKNVPPEASKEYATGRKLAQKGQLAEARRHFARAVELYPKFVEARNELAVTLMKDGKLAEAEEILRQAVDVDPVALHPLLNLGLCLSRQEKYGDAVPYLDKALQLQPGQPPALLLLGVALLMTGKDREAEPVLLRAYELGGKAVAPAQYHLARIYLRRKDRTRAIEAMEAFLRDAPDDPVAAEVQRTLERLRSSSQQP